MELVTLDSNFQLNKMVENYENLIWTERYAENGEFQLQSFDISATMAAMPKESYVSLRESTVPMKVEDHKIIKKRREGPRLLVTGRAFETVLERRASVKELPSGLARAAWTITAAKESDAAYKAIRVVIGDFARSQGGTQVLALINPAISALDAIPEIDLTLPADYSTGTANTYDIKPGNLYAVVMEMLKANNRGLKSVRPAPGGTKVAVEIYNGADLTGSVVFDARFDQIDDATYLLSERGSTNVAYVYGPNGSQQVLKTTAPEPSGLARRVLLVDLMNDSNANTTAIRTSRGLVELYKYNATALFDGEIAEQVAAGYNTKYHLGDILKLTGEYGLSQNVRVAEFIRSSDANGEKAYPTFEAVS